MDASSSSSSFVLCSKRLCYVVDCSCKPYSEPPMPTGSSGVSCAPEPDSAQPSASSSKKARLEPPALTLNSFPEDLVAQIISRVSAIGWNGDFFNAVRVSRQFSLLSEERYVLRSASSHFIDNSLLSNVPCRRRLFEICLASGHPHAQFRQGNVDYFMNQRREIRFRNLISSANQGYPRGLYVCGMLFLCLGGPDTQRGLNMLYSLMHPYFINESMTMVGNLRRSTAFHFWHVGYGADTMRELRQGYIRDPCRCNGRTTTFMEMSQWQRHGRDIPISEACLICFWDHQVKRYFQGFD